MDDRPVPGNTMKAARVRKAGEIVIEEVPVPRLGERDLLIRVHRVGLCGTDAGVLHGHVKARLPVTAGHEFSGTIAKVGSLASGGFKEGERVTAAGSWGCGACEFCLKGMGRFCKARSALGRTVDGCLAEFVRVDSRAVYALPTGVSLDDGQNFLNLACVIRAYKKVPMRPGSKAVIFGAGNIGLSMSQVLKLAGASRVVVLGTRDSRLQMAQNLGATDMVNVARVSPVQAVLELIPEGADLVVEATGNPAAFQQAVEVLGAGGSLVSIGIFDQKIEQLDISFLYQKEATIYGSRGGEDGYDEALRLLQEKRVKIAPMITHRFPLEDTAKAFEVFADKSSNAVRVVVEPA